jgi:hypothetical protein
MCICIRKQALPQKQPFLDHLHLHEEWGIHIIVNNQLGFTTSNEMDARSTPYSTDVAKMIECPILHVNGDDPEMVVFAAKLACEYRYTFKKDIIIDIFKELNEKYIDDPEQRFEWINTVEEYIKFKEERYLHKTK